MLNIVLSFFLTFQFGLSELGSENNEKKYLPFTIEKIIEQKIYNPATNLEININVKNNTLLICTYTSYCGTCQSEILKTIKKIINDSEKINVFVLHLDNNKRELLILKKLSELGSQFKLGYVKEQNLFTDPFMYDFPQLFFIKKNSIKLKYVAQKDGEENLIDFMSEVLNLAK